MDTYCWCVHALQTSTLCEGCGTHRSLLVYRFSATSLHNGMPDSFSLDTYHLEHICEDTQSRIFELCSSRGGLKFRRAAISSKWERRVGLRGRALIGVFCFCCNVQCVINVLLCVVVGHFSCCIDV